ncbi:MAG: diaminopimelate decarboxylase [Chloroflexi bacterium]|nr:diaminopimelate decarboxylase [Chloroflexota bacterium]
MLPDSAEVLPSGHLAVGGCDLVDLVQQHGTPLYVYDEATILARARAYRDGLRAAYPGDSLVCYASKAYSARWLLQLLAAEGLGLDVVSGGELHVARSAGFPMERTYFHGNNKGEDELAEAVSAGISRVVIDNLEEVERLNRICGGLDRVQPVLLRLTPGVEPHTHEYIRTGAVDTKFGMAIQTGAAEEAVRRIQAAPNLALVGYHAHIGSQIFDLEPFQESARRVMQFAADMLARQGVKPREISPGGGFGMRYTPADDPRTPGDVVGALAEAVLDAAETLLPGEPLPRMTIEPGRSLVATAGVALYTVGSIKHIHGVRTYVAVDGGMADNIRPATYGAEYSSLLANRAGEAPATTVTIAGKYCESGDILVREAHLPAPRVGDVVALPASGAYNLAMASHYNMALKPAVVAIRDGQARLVRRRDTYDDLLRAEV